MGDSTRLSLDSDCVEKVPQPQKTHTFHCYTGVNLGTWTNISQHSFKKEVSSIQRFSVRLSLDKVFILQEPYKEKHLSKLVITK